MNYVEFFGGSYFLAWCSLWLFWSIVPICEFIYRCFKRMLRSLNIALHGWPPSHIDADGDWKECN